MFRDLHHLIRSPEGTFAKCQVCGHEGHSLVDHVMEEHGMTLAEYAEAYPKSPTISHYAYGEFMSANRAERKPVNPSVNLRITWGPDNVPLPINPDVPASACLPNPPHYRIPQFGALREDVATTARWFSQGHSMYISGSPGTGKDGVVHALSHAMRKPGLIFPVSPSQDIEGWLSIRGFSPDGTVWEDGELLKAIRDGYVTSSGRRIGYTILLSDFDRATPEQAEFLRLVIDSIDGRVKSPDGQTHRVCPGTIIVATANTQGGGDESGRMVSAQQMDGSLLDRFKRKIIFHNMDWRDEGEVIRSKFPLLHRASSKIIPQMGAATAALRTMIENGDLYADFSHRGVTSWAEEICDLIRFERGVTPGVMFRAARCFLDGLPDTAHRKSAAAAIRPHIDNLSDALSAEELNLPDFVPTSV